MPEGAWFLQAWRVEPMSDESSKGGSHETCIARGTRADRQCRHRVFNTDEVANLGITSKSNFLTANMGGGLKWFASRHWGVRSDYRLMLVDGKETAPAFFGRDSIRYGHRVSAGLVFTN